MVHSRHRYLNLTSDLDTDDLIDKRWSVTSTSNFQKVWNWSLNSWFLRIELTVTFDRLTLFHLIDGIWNIPKLKIIGWTGLNWFEHPSVDSWPVLNGPDRGPDFLGYFPISKRRKVRPLFEVMDSSFVESIYSANFYGFFEVSPDLKSWKRHFDISIWCHRFEIPATVSKYTFGQRSTARKSPLIFHFYFGPKSTGMVLGSLLPMWWGQLRSKRVNHVMGWFSRRSKNSSNSLFLIWI